MRRIFTSAALGTLLLLTSYGVGFAQDYDTPWAAFKRDDYATAFREYSALASNGDAVGQFFLGMMYEKGLGVTQDYREALKWYRQSAEQGHPGAQHSLGLMYESLIRN